MKSYIKAVLLISFIGAVHAEVNVVSDSAENGAYQAKILSKEIVFDKQDRLVSRQVCNRILQRTHYDRFDNSITVMTPNQISCRIVYENETQNILSGYYVTYDYKGKIMSTKLNYDPGEFIKIQQGR
jgi:hypothetical protein